MRVNVSLTVAQANALHRVLLAASQNEFEAVQAYLGSDALAGLDALVDGLCRRKQRMAQAEEKRRKEPCLSGWTGDRCTKVLDHKGPHSNE